MSKMFDNNFIVRMLYKDVYWLCCSRYSDFQCTVLYLYVYDANRKHCLDNVDDTGVNFAPLAEEFCIICSFCCLLSFLLNFRDFKITWFYFSILGWIKYDFKTILSQIKWRKNDLDHHFKIMESSHTVQYSLADRKKECGNTVGLATDSKGIRPVTILSYRGALDPEFCFSAGSGSKPDLFTWIRPDPNQTTRIITLFFTTTGRNYQRPIRIESRSFAGP